MNNSHSRYKFTSGKICFLLTTLFLICSCTHEREKKHDSVPSDTQTNAVVPAPPERGKLLNPVSSIDGRQLYALYIPVSSKPVETLPFIIFFDPHADGVFPLSKYMRLADNYGIALLGSLGSENGQSMDQAVAIANSLVNECVQRYHSPVKNITLAGFSGGAKVALASASSIPGLASIIYCGAAFAPRSLNGLPPALGIAGLKDMNFTEVVAYSNSLDELSIRHALVQWNGKHEWPDTTTFQTAMIWAKLHSSPTADEKKFLNDNYRNVFEKYRKNSDPLVQASALEQAIAFGFDDPNPEVLQKELSRLKNTGVYRAQKSKEEESQKQENAMKEKYIQSFDGLSLEAWKNETTLLHQRLQDPVSQRLLAYISLAAYSYSNNALKQGNFTGAEKYLAIYALADPENSEQPFLSACLAARQNKNEEAVRFLQKAIDLGLTQRKKVEREESFVQLRGSESFSRILSQLH